MSIGMFQCLDPIVAPSCSCLHICLTPVVTPCEPERSRKQLQSPGSYHVVLSMAAAVGKKQHSLSMHLGHGIIYRKTSI